VKNYQASQALIPKRLAPSSSQLLWMLNIDPNGHYRAQIGDGNFHLADEWLLILLIDLAGVNHSRNHIYVLTNKEN
jgi:hypothetical protein